MSETRLLSVECSSDHVVESCFKHGVGHPSVFHHPVILVHGDKSCSDGYTKSLDWFEDVFAKRYEIKTQRKREGMTRNGEDVKKEGQVLIGVVRKTDHGLESEADLRHAGLIGVDR